MYTVYSKDNCPACVKAKNLLQFKEKQYVEIKIVNIVNDVTKEISREDFFEKFPGIKSVPYIIDSDGNTYKTFDELSLSL